MICNISSVSSAILTTLMIAGFLACDQETKVDEDIPLAKVYNKTLYLSELEGMIPENMTREDSLLMSNAIIERWVRENLLLFEAEQNIPGDLNIEELVEDYRSSLILNNYEKILVETSLDSTVNKETLAERYEQNRDQYILTEPVMKLFLLKIPVGSEEESEFNKLWLRRSSDMEEWYQWINTNEVKELFDTSQWVRNRDINAMVPGEKPAGGWKIERYTREDDETAYFLRPIEIYNEGDVAPLAYVEPRLKSMILHKRKIDLIEEHKEELYERESKRNNVKIYAR